jgi:hypothetical protein
MPRCSRLGGTSAAMAKLATNVTSNAIMMILLFIGSGFVETQKTAFRRETQDFASLHS